MKNSADLGGCYPPRLSASVDNTLLDLQNSSYPTQPHSIIANSTVPGVVKVERSDIDLNQQPTLNFKFRFRVASERLHLQVK